jgi:hypothetical protein
MLPTCYVLYCEHDGSPHEVRVFETREDAELYAMAYAQDVWMECEEGDEDEDELPSGERLGEILEESSEHLRLYRCAEDSSQELDLRCFAAPPDKEAA